MERLKSNVPTGDPAEAGRKALELVRDIAARGAASRDPAVVGYALQELTQVLYERTGDQERRFEPIAIGEIAGLESLVEELSFVDGCLQDM